MRSSVLVVTMLLAACAPSTQAIQTAIVETRWAAASATIAPSKTAASTRSPTARPTSTTPPGNQYVLEIGICFSYLGAAGDPKALGCQMLKKQSMSLADNQEASIDVDPAIPGVYAYCALFRADGSLVSSFVNPTAGRSTVRCAALSSAPVPTPAPGTRTAVAGLQQATRAALDKQISATGTAAAREAAATAKLLDAQATSAARAELTTATAYFKGMRATEIAAYSTIELRELLTYPGNHKGEKVTIRGRVFNIDGKIVQIYVDGYDAVYTEMKDVVSGIYEDDYIRVYGMVYGSYCFQNAMGAQVCQPALVDAFFVEE